MAILNHGSTLRTADGGQTTTTIVTAANIGTYGVATNSTYYVGTTQNIFNRASGAQTLTGVSIDGNAANITAYTINQNVGTANAPSFAGMTSTAMLVSSTSMSSNDDWSNSPISIRERGLVSAAQSINAYSPNINFHWASRISNSLWMDANGNLAWGSYSETGVPSSDGAFYAANLYASIYFDKNDTAYYLDAGNTGTSLLVAGKVGIGTTSPGYTLTVNGTIASIPSAGNPIFIGNDGTYGASGTGRYVALGFGGLANSANKIFAHNMGEDGLYICSATSRSIYFRAGGGAADHVVITSGGNLGVATNAADTNLQVVGHVHVGNQTTFENAGGWNKTIYLDGNYHARLRILGSAYASGKNSQTETYLWVDNTVSPYSGLVTNAGSFTINAGFTTLTGSARSPIFYDSDNTAYYIDAASTSNLVGLTVANTITGSVSGSSASCTGNAATATILQTARNINGTSFNGSAAITTASWGTARTLTIGSTGKSVDGSAAVSWSLAELGAAATNQTMFIGTTSVAINRASASQTLTGVSIDGNAATATNGLTTSNYVSYSAFTGAISSGGSITATSYIYTSTYLQTGGNLIYPSGYGSTQRLEVGNSANNNWIDGLTIAPGGTVTAPDNMRSPIFYDSNDTAYYGDFASTSKQYQAILFGDSSRYSAVSATINGTGAGDKLILYGNASNYDARVLVGADYDFIFKSQGSPSSKGMFRFYSGNSATLALEISATQNTTSTGDFRAPIFYDSNNTAYYLDPASTSNLYYIVMPHIGNGSPNLVVNNSASENWNAIKINGGNDNNGIGFSNTSHSAFARNNLSFHTHNLDSIRFHSSGWDTLFEVAGSSGNAWLKGGSFDSSFTRLVNPGGAYYVTGTSTITGAIKIRLPRLKVDTMMRMTVKIYQYNTGQSATIECGGYDYSGDGIWRNIFAYQNSDLFATVNVRFGNDGTYDCVWIGETSSTWSYPQVFVTDFQAGYNNYTSAWGTGWNISYVTAFDTVTDTRVAYKTLNASNYNSYSPTLTGTGASGSWGISVTGSSASCTGNAATVTNGVYTTGDQTISGIKYFTSTVDPSTVPAGYAGGYLYESTTGFGTYGIIFGSATGQHGAIGYSSNTMYFGTENGTDNTLNTKATLSSGGTFAANGDVRAPIFYDSNDTAYYVDPASESKLNYLRLTNSNALYFTTTSVAELNNEGNSTNVAFRMIKSGSSNSDGNNYGVLNLQRTNHTNGATNAGGSIFFELKDSGGTIREYAGISGCKTEAGAAGGRLIFHRYARTEVGYWDADQLYSSSSVRSLIFYDSDNTAYYLNPNSTTSLRTVGSWRSDSSTWDGEFSGKIQYHSNHWYFQSGDLWIFRNSGGTNVATINQSGTISAAFSGSLTGNVTGNVTGTAINIAGNGAGYDTYGTIGVTEPAGASNYSYYGLTRQSNIGCGFGLTGTTGALGLGANAFWFGSATSTAAGVMGSAYIAFNGSNLVAVGTADATQFRDKDNTAYYINPAGNSIVSSLTFDSNITIYKYNDRNLIIKGTGNSDAGILGRGAADQFAFQLYGSGGGDYGFLDGAWAAWDIRKTVDGNLYLNDNNTYYLNPPSTTNLNNLTVAGDVRSPIFYDSNNTAYYLDPASTSNLVGLTVANTITGSISGSSTFIASLGSGLNYDIDRTTKRSGLSHYSGYSTGTNRPTSYDYTLQVTDGNKGWEISMDWIATTGPAIYARSLRDCCQNWSSWVRILDNANYSFAANMNQNVRTTDNVTFVNVTGAIFYDAANTAYYIDPASTSVMNQINLAGILRRTASAAGYLEGNYPTGVDGNSSSAIYTIGGGYQPTATGLGNMYGCGYTVGNGTANPGLGATGWGFYVAGGGVSRIFLDSEVGYGIASNSWRAPVFYDSNNTAYYVDPNSTSNLVGLTVANTITGSITGNSATTTLATKATRANGNFYIDDNYGNTVVGVYSASRYQGVFAMGDSYKLVADGSTTGNLYGIAWSHQNAGGAAANLASHGLLILENGAFKGAWGGGSLRTPGDVRGTLFYDWDNTAYYCDPASTSNLNAITAAGNITAAQYYTGGWFRNNSSGNGLYNEATGQHFYSDSANYWNVASSASAQGIRLRTGGHNGTVRGYFYADTNNDVGLLNQDGSWRLRVVGGDYSLADGSSMRAQIFYDSNNTGYYIDAASTSILNLVRTRNTFGERTTVTSASSTTIDTQYNVTELTMSAFISTLTFSNIQASGIVHMWTIVTLGNGSATSVTWPAAIKWPGGTAPNITGTNTKRDIYQFVTYDGGTSIYAIIVGQNL